MFKLFLKPLMIFLVYLIISGCSTIPCGDSQLQQEVANEPWVLQYQRSGGILGLSQKAEFTSTGKRSVTHRDQTTQTLATLNPAALAHLSNLVNEVSKQPFLQREDKPKICPDCTDESVQLHLNNSVIYYANSATLPKAQEELLKFLAEHTPMR